MRTASSGPSQAASSAPLMTTAIARLACVFGTYSVAAKRYCMTTALLEPSRNAAAQKSQKRPVAIAYPASTQPAPACRALQAKTVRRPKRWIRAPAGNTLAASPAISTDTGSVASAGVGARCEPMIPPSRTNRKLPDMHSACVAESIQTGRMAAILHSAKPRRPCDAVHTRLRRRRAGMHG